MATWPTISKPFIETPTTVKDNSLTSELVNGMKISRRRYTRQLREWTLNWPALPNSHYDLLAALYSEVGGGSATFAWQDQYGNSYTVRFASGLDSRAVSPALQNVTVKLEEV